MKEALKLIGESDKRMARLIAAAGACTLKPKRSVSPFHALAESIAYQQLTGKAAQTIWNRVLAIYEGKYPSPEQLAKTPPALLRSAGLSQAKVTALLDLSQKTIEGLVPTSAEARKLSDVELVERISLVRGIGPWTVQMFLIFTLGRPDVMPSADYGVRVGFAKTFKRPALPTPKELLTYSEKWRPFRTFAAWYLWRAVDLHKSEKKQQVIKAPRGRTPPRSTKVAAKRK